MTPIDIRDFSDEDTPAVIGLIRELQAHEIELHDRMKHPDDIGAWYIDDLKAECAKHDGHFIVAEHETGIVGYAVVLTNVPYEDPDEVPYTFAYVNDIAVTEAMRGMGIGRQLLMACEQRAIAAGQRWLRISVLAQNRSALGLYRSFGFSDHLVQLEKPLD